MMMPKTARMGSSRGSMMNEKSSKSQTIKWPLWKCLAYFGLFALGLCFFYLESIGRPQATVHPDNAKVEITGLDNVICVTTNLYSGSAPEDEASFKALAKLGIKTVISVDGARPDAEMARKFGLRYVHIPVGYDGISQEQALRLAKAATDLPGPIYLHCHHGKHRGPAAAAVVRFCLDDQCTAAQAIEVMKQAGTDPRYQGLFAAPGKITRPTARQLADLPSNFPEAAKIAALVEAMVAIDMHWDHLILIRTAGWKAPADLPDLVPAHEALQLVEHFREIARLLKTKNRPEDFRAMLGAAEKGASELEALLQEGRKKGQVDGSKAEKLFQQSKSACAQCHAKYRDVPQTVEK
jgi:protein tyrosine phosphatase (PTP) superfamily phosphohydrolase (DUF442 family)